MFKLLILSVGSLLGQVMLDGLENRRSKLHIVGTNSVADAASNYRCDEVFLTQETLNADFLAQFEALLNEVSPDFILPGRDDDIVFLAQYAEKNPILKQKIPCGSSELATVFRDKWLSYQWAKERHLPFARSFIYDAQCLDKEGYTAFIQEVGFPLVVKPRKGFGSNGVVFVQNASEMRVLSQQGPLLLQECLGDTAHFDRYRAQYAQGMPLFFQIPQYANHSAQILIAPDGTCEHVFCSHNKFVMGKIERISRYEPEAFMPTVYRYIEALSECGWRGPANIAAMPDKKGVWKVHEVNLRMTGATSMRLAYGFDELKNTLNAFTNYDLPTHPFSTDEGDVVMIYQTQRLKKTWLNSLEKTGHWQKG